MAAHSLVLMFSHGTEGPVGGTGLDGKPKAGQGRPLANKPGWVGLGAAERGQPPETRLLSLPCLRVARLVSTRGGEGGGQPRPVLNLGGGGRGAEQVTRPDG